VRRLHAKKPSPSIAASRLRPVLAMVPFCQLVVVPPEVTSTADSSIAEKSRSAAKRVVRSVL
jgi:hypothetical protein